MNEMVETVSELIEKLQGLKDWESKQDIFQKLKMITKTLARAKPILRVHTQEKMYSGKCQRMEIKDEKLKFILKDSRIWKKEVKILDELIDIVPWKDKDGKTLFWENLF